MWRKSKSETDQVVSLIGGANDLNEILKIGNSWNNSNKSEIRAFALKVVHILKLKKL